MIEKRKYTRIKAIKAMGGKVLLSSDIELIDISLGGIHFVCSKRLTTNSVCTIALACGSEKVSFRGMIVRSIFRGVRESQKDKHPVYEIAMEFSNLSDHQLTCLKRVIESLGTSS
ncbi:MAG: PilZ domain-containing protein [bacterium]